MPLKLMLIPSTSCPARCRYCFGPRGGQEVMGEDVLQGTLDWLDDLRHCRPDGGIDLIFHGGEPLTAGTGFFRRALPRLRRALADRPPKLTMQSNLWLLSGELCELLGEYGVSLGTSLDGPEAVTDAQRGPGYFRRTMAGIRLARRHGLRVGCICTFTSRSAPQAAAIMDFFIREGLDFTIHAAVPPLVDTGLGAAPETPPERWTLSPEAYGVLLVELLDAYLLNLQRIRIGTLDLLSCSISTREGGICTHRDCLGGYLAVAPDGSIYPCQRFAGMGAYRLGGVQDQPGLEQLGQSPAWRLLKEREEHLSAECGDCAYFDICRGGCPYNALAAGPAPVSTGEAPDTCLNGRPQRRVRGSAFRSLRDPYCAAYRRIFGYITERALEEVFAEENLREVVARPGGSLLRSGRLLSVMRGSGRRPGPEAPPAGRGGLPVRKEGTH